MGHFVMRLIGSGIRGNLSHSEVDWPATLPRARCRTNTDTRVGQTLTPSFPKVLQKNQTFADLLPPSPALSSHHHPRFDRGVHGEIGKEKGP